MAGISQILGALWRAVWRDLRSLNSLTGNNFFLVCMLLMLQPQSAYFLLLLVGVLLLFPLSSDPMSKIPPSRLALWPLTNGQMVALRVASFWLSPVVWIAAAIILWAARPMLGIQFFLVAAAFHALSIGVSAMVARAPSTNPFLHIPPVPTHLGRLVQKNIRETLSVLDPYLAAIMALCGTIFRIVKPDADKDAFLGIAMLTVLAMSTYGQCLFALDSGSGFTRYKLLPVQGWRIVAAKDAAFLLVLLPLVLPLAPIAGMAAGMAALAVGNHASVLHRHPQPQWRFTGGANIETGIAQVFCLVSAGVTTYRTHWSFVFVCAAALAASIWYYGRKFDRQR
jgi:hypothetical protein